MSNSPPPPEWGQPGQSGQPGPPGPPEYGQGPGISWGQGQPPPPPSGRRTSVPFILAGVGVLVVIIVLAVVLALNSGGSGSPQDAADDFIAAAKAHDCEKAYALLSDDLQKQEGDCTDNESNIVPSEDQKVEFGAVKIADETDTEAKAMVDVTIDDQTLTLTLGMVKQGDDWKIDSFE